MATLLVVVPLVGSGCADDVVPGTSGRDMTSTSTGADSTLTNLVTGLVDEGTAEGVGGTSGGTTEGTTTSLDTSGDGSTDTTGEPPGLPSQTQTQLVSSGQQMSSPNHTMVYTIGQPSQLQSTHVSPNYLMQGGLIGANGSPP